MAEQENKRTGCEDGEKLSSESSIRHPAGDNRTKSNVDELAPTQGENQRKERSQQKAGNSKDENGKRKKIGPIKIALGVSVLLVVTFFGIRFWLHAQHYEETDDAYVTAHSHSLSFRVNGTVSDVMVDDNQIVKSGQPIAKLDPHDFEVALEQANASLEQSRAQFAQSEAQIGQADANRQQSQSQADSAKAKLADTQRNYDRNTQLFQKGGVISKQDLDNSTFQLEQDQASYHAAAAAVRIAEANFHTAEAQKKASQAQIRSAESNVSNAKLQLSYTTLLAPADGSIANKNLEVGQRVQPGQAVMSVVERYVWIVANFKETQLGRIRPGQPVEIAVDAIKGRKFDGTIDSFQKGTGAVFALLPPDNATGNFTKIVQRIPVKIVFDPASIRGFEDKVVPGLSTMPSVRVQ